MKKYERAEMIVTECDVEDVIITSGVPSDPDKSVTMNSPNYQSGSGDGVFGWNWTLWQ